MVIKGSMDKEKLKSNGPEALAFILSFVKLSFVKRHIPSVLAGVAVLMSVDLIQIIIPKIIQRTIDILGDSFFSNELVIRNTLLILALAFGMVILRFFWRIFIMGTSRKIEKEVREDMYSHLQRLGFSYFNRTQTGHLMALMVNDVNAIRMATGPSFLAITDALFMGSLSLIFLFSLNTRLAFFTILPLPCIIFMITKYGPLIQRRFKAVQESFSTISSHTQESFSGVRVIKGFVQEDHEIDAFEAKCEDYVQMNLKLIKIWGFFFPAVTLFANLSLAILYLIGGRTVIAGTLTFGEFVSFSMYLGLLIWPVIAIGWVFTIFHRGIASAKRILELIKAQPDIVESRTVDFNINHIEGSIEFEDLNFSYGGNQRQVLRHINLHIPAGTSLGIMGKPGSGKSTLIALLFRLFPFHDGNIIIDGHDIHDIPLTLLRSNIGYVPQDPFLFSDTISNNISFGIDAEPKDTSEVKRLARLTAMFDEIVEFGDQFETIVGERGITLSGGQKQRLSIARALMIRPRILVLDDALSSVDAATEREVLRNIRSEMDGKTTICISHRVSTIKDCDKILILEEGKIKEYGTHRELTRVDGYYNKLFELQKLEEKIKD
jgi:ATP-binding cassette subfamily B protein